MHGRRGGGSRRREVRRAVALECQVLSDYWNEPVPLPSADLSPQGLSLDSPLLLDRGAQVLLSLVPPGQRHEVCALAEVVWVVDPAAPLRGRSWGMGLRFTDVDAGEQARLASALSGRPPPLPRRRRGPRTGPEMDAPRALRFEALGELLGAA